MKTKEALKIARISFQWWPKTEKEHVLSTKSSLIANATTATSENIQLQVFGFNYRTGPHLTYYMSLLHVTQPLSLTTLCHSITQINNIDYK